MDYDEAGGFSQKGGTRIIDYSPPRLDNTGNLRGVAPLGPLDETELDEGTILDATDNEIGCFGVIEIGIYSVSG